VRVPSDEALELLDFMVEVGAVGVAGAATFQQLVDALDIRSAERLHDLLAELVSDDYVRRKLPAAITGRTTYYVEQSRYDRLLKSFDDDPSSIPPPETDWTEIRRDVKELSKIVENADLSQENKAQAGAIAESIRILVEAPSPPKKTIRNLLYDLAALATLFALAIEIADKIK
jgi:hypothetical protein